MLIESWRSDANQTRRRRPAGCLSRAQQMHTINIRNVNDSHLHGHNLSRATHQGKQIKDSKGDFLHSGNPGTERGVCLFLILLPYTHLHYRKTFCTLYRNRYSQGQTHSDSQQTFSVWKPTLFYTTEHSWDLTSWASDQLFIVGSSTSAFFYFGQVRPTLKNEKTHSLFITWPQFRY